MLMARNRLGRDVFGRGAPEPLVIDRQPAYADNLIDLLKAYAQRRREERHRARLSGGAPAVRWPKRAAFSSG